MNASVLKKEFSGVRIVVETRNSFDEVLATYC
jgi:hypothetical protein